MVVGGLCRIVSSAAWMASDRHGDCGAAKPTGIAISCVYSGYDFALDVYPFQTVLHEQ